MKSSRIVSWVALVNVSVLLACGGVSSIGSSAGAEAGTSAGSAKAGSSPAATGPSGLAGKGGSTGKGESTGWEGPSVGGKAPATMPGTVTMPQAGTGSGVTCMTDAECPGFGEPCETCPDGSFACNQAYCDMAQGRCARTFASCDLKCATDLDCPVPDFACTGCGDGTEVCPKRQCLMGVCDVSYPGCAGYDPCESASCGSQCSVCPAGGTCDPMVLSYCSDQGLCRPGPANCAVAMCQTAMDCGTPPPECKPCMDGSCASFDCVDSSCALTCPSSSPTCKSNHDCPPIVDGSCTICPNGRCAVPACIQDSCELVCPVK